MKLLNVGILAHVDAGKTSLTERLLFHAGAIRRLGRVDRGTTQTDSAELERDRGITISTGVAAFRAGDLTVNLVDTPGHPDFIAEVERSLRVLDGVVLVLSSVEGVQAQTRVLMRTLIQLRMPTVLFLNKIDRAGARPDGVLADVLTRLTARAVPLGEVHDAGTPRAGVRALVPDGDALAEFAAADGRDAFVARYLDGTLDPAAIREELAEGTRAGRLHPVFFGSAVTGAGIAELVDGLGELLPATSAAPGGPLAGRLFKIDSHGAYLRVYSGELRARQVVALRRRHLDGPPTEHLGKVTAIAVAEPGGFRPAGRVGPGQIARLTGLADARIGDSLGAPPDNPADQLFAPPVLEAVVGARRPADAPRLATGLRELARRDPLITLVERDGELSVRLYGEVQGEVIAAQLAAEFGVEPVLAQPRTVHRERVTGVGEAARAIDERERTDPWATVGLRVEPGTGVGYRLAVELGSLPLAFHAAIEQGVRAALRQGPHGWPVTDCLVTLTRSGFASPISTAGDFRALAAELARFAVERAGTRVDLPVRRIELEVPPDTLNPVLGALAAAGGTVRAIDANAGRIDADLPQARLPELARRLPRLTRGEALLTPRGVSWRPL
ncbi:tetracycline resistance ribosomal protection protein Otr(A) [Pseudonocardia eucalypti]|uniref:Tetracycline resistance ribosomal protection protein Otr(A) n=1 Tax=Pseudonocardia eucalypti TaxID=648755 RepID=A0ABP9Q889_9PSEU|nr:ribosomal protection tetracycline resistance protein [Pseudonocardia eucalypti]